VVIAAATSDLGGLADSVDNVVPFLDDSDSGLYYASSSEIMLVAPGGEIIAAGTYATDISAEDIESVLP
jgi:hypothetical protein